MAAPADVDGLHRTVTAMQIEREQVEKRLDEAREELRKRFNGSFNVPPTTLGGGSPYEHRRESTVTVRNLDTGDENEITLDSLEMKNDFLETFNPASHKFNDLNQLEESPTNADTNICADGGGSPVVGEDLSSAENRRMWNKLLNPFKKNKPVVVMSSQQPQQPQPSESTAASPASEHILPEAQQCPVRTVSKSFVELSNLWCVRELSTDENCPIWSLSISPNFKWLAVGTQKGSIFLWFLDDRPEASWLTSDKPRLRLAGHRDSIINLHWAPTAKTSRLLSTSLDKTIRLWRPDKGFVYAVATLNCSDWPTSACFHPLLKDIIFCGSLDATVQVWRLHPLAAEGKSVRRYEGRVIEYMKVAELVTCLSISPNGCILAVGFRHGAVAFYDAKSLKYRSEVDCRNRRGKNAKGRKVTGLQWDKYGSSLIVTTNDSRIRMLDMNDLSCVAKLKGHVNDQIMLTAQFTPSQQQVVCGSENGWVHMWDVKNSHIPVLNPRFNLTRKARPTNFVYESFRAFAGVLTSCVVLSEDCSNYLLDKIVTIPSVQADAASDEGSGARACYIRADKLVVPVPPVAPWLKDPNGYSAKHVGFVVGSYQGSVRMFINFGDTLRR
eukprot:GHVS01036959.1.p1 GENE.GHVS01036959.1~~GHVS01036959.1.p1  ORF type:complete len:636 (-),score=73.92 GHVS01036959.1:2359-4191(-)